MKGSCRDVEAEGAIWLMLPQLPKGWWKKTEKAELVA